MTTIQPDSRVGRLAAEHPHATRVFERHDIDYCCGGGETLQDACHRRGLDLERVIHEIQREIAGSPPEEENWVSAPLGDLIAHILTDYHEPLREELPRLGAMAEKVLAVHRDKDPERLAELVQVVHALGVELEEHMAKEEQILFPLIHRNMGRMAQGPIAVMEHEHEDTGKALRRLRELTDGYAVPAEACSTWRALWHGLAALEESLHRHIHLENSVLFPRALADAH